MAERLRASARVRLRSDPSALVGDHPPTLEPHCWTGKWPRRCAKGLASNVALLHTFDTLAAWRSACAPQHACGCVQIRPHWLAIILRPWSRTVGLADGPGRARKVLQAMSHVCTPLTLWQRGGAPARLSTRAAAFRSVRIGWRSSSDLGAALLDWQMAQEVRERSCHTFDTLAQTCDIACKTFRARPGPSASPTVRLQGRRMIANQCGRI